VQEYTRGPQSRRANHIDRDRGRAALDQFAAYTSIGGRRGRCVNRRVTPNKIPGPAVSKETPAAVAGQPGRQGNVSNDEISECGRFRVEPHAYGVFRAAAISNTSLGSAGVCLGNTRALVACSKS
jgi:hypothetical protein